MSKIESSVADFRKALIRYQRPLVWTALVLLFIWLCVAVKETTSLVILSYALALLLDPIVNALGKLRIRRSFSIALIIFLTIIIIFSLLITAIPALINQYNYLISQLPDYISKISGVMRDRFGVELPISLTQILLDLRDYVSNLRSENLRVIAAALGSTVLQGYSWTLTLLNLFLLPFLLFYIFRDLKEIHRFLLGFLPREARRQVRTIGGEIMGHVYAFFRGQIIVATIMAFLYSAGLLLVGLPSAVVVGMLSGFLGMVPYLGVGIGLVLATVITLVTDPSWGQLISVWAVIGIVQAIEGNLLTPMIVGRSVGIHPLGAMLALIVGGQLFGLIGLIIAIPSIAALRVLFAHLFSAINRGSAEPAAA